MSIALVGVALNTPIQLMDISEIESLASADGYQLFLVARDIALDQNVTQRILRDLVGRRVDGLILHRPVPVPPATVRMLLDLPVPVVFTQYAEPLAHMSVGVNRLLAIRELARHMAGLGHRQALFIGAQWDWDQPSGKLDHYRKAWHEHHMQLFNVRRWVLGDKSRLGHGPQGYAVVKDLLQHIQPTALIMTDDDAAIGAMTAIHEAGLQVPKDISVVGFDDVPNASIARPALTTIHQPRGETGRAAYRLLLQHLQEPSDTPQHIVINSRLVLRDSVGPARTKQRLLSDQLLIDDHTDHLVTHLEEDC
ncbi:LacI family DNA-binding transcriptional regulator [Phycisphaerales bacterium AB-hyl4]|uniref:LacI family DNA-binding transcriptional regulator n=1 Tax=Natronomicrosphaera hydrolytica TaxID=3242702 RepID=A0ABV4U6V7_9BACT